MSPLYRGVEQLAARRAHNPEVVGSSPAAATIKPLISHEISGFFVKKLWEIFPDAYLMFTDAYLMLIFNFPLHR